MRCLLSNILDKTREVRLNPPVIVRPWEKVYRLEPSQWCLHSVYMLQEEIFMGTTALVNHQQSLVILNLELY